jgi:crossover junction endodeoxyribonuclease RuvC
LVRGIPIFEYSPKKIKQSVTGNGNATKEQVAAMLQKVLLIKNLPHNLDATDALGAAVCHYFQEGIQSVSDSSATGNKKVSGWKAFLAQNPGRKV